MRAVWATAVAWAVGLGCVTPSARVRAEPNAASDSAGPEYKQLVQQALHEYELGNFSEAKVFFSQAHTLLPTARTLRGLGMCAYELRNYVESIGYFEQALSSKQRPLTVPMNQEVSRLLSQARSFVTRLTLQLQPSNAQLRVDTRPVSPGADGSVLLDPGTHELSVEAPEYESSTHTIRTNGAEALSLSVALHRTHDARAEPSASAGAGAGAGMDGEAPSESSTGSQLPRLPNGALAGTPSQGSDSAAASQVGPWVLIGAGAAVAIAGGVLLAVALDYKHQVEQPTGVDGEAPRYSAVKSKDDLVFPLSFAGVAGLGVGLASVAGGVIWKVTTAGNPERPSTEVEVGLGRVTLSGSF
jgi:hypothetical protein